MVGGFVVNVVGVPFAVISIVIQQRAVGTQYRLRIYLRIDINTCLVHVNHRVISRLVMIQYNSLRALDRDRTP